MRNQIDKAQLLNDENSSVNVSYKTDEFLRKAKGNLTLALKADRLALLSKPEEYNTRVPIRRASVSPKNIVPSEYRLCLIKLDGDLYQIQLELEDIIIGDVGAHFKDNPQVESLVNISQALNAPFLHLMELRGFINPHKQLGFRRGTESKITKYV